MEVVETIVITQCLCSRLDHDKKLRYLKHSGREGQAPAALAQGGRRRLAKPTASSPGCLRLLCTHVPFQRDRSAECLGRALLVQLGVRFRACERSRSSLDSKV